MRTPAALAVIRGTTYQVWRPLELDLHGCCARGRVARKRDRLSPSAAGCHAVVRGKPHPDRAVAIASNGLTLGLDLLRKLTLIGGEGEGRALLKLVLQRTSVCLAHTQSLWRTTPTLAHNSQLRPSGSTSSTLAPPGRFILARKGQTTQLFVCARTLLAARIRARTHACYLESTRAEELHCIAVLCVQPGAGCVEGDSLAPQR